MPERQSPLTPQSVHGGEHLVPGTLAQGQGEIIEGINDHQSMTPRATHLAPSLPSGRIPITPRIVLYALPLLHINRPGLRTANGQERSVACNDRGSIETTQAAA